MCYILPPLLFGLCPVFTFTLILLLCLPFGKRSLALVTLKNRLAYRGVDSGQELLTHNQGFWGGIAFSAASSGPSSFAAMLYCR